jgi:hypothetical protein
MFSEIRVVFKRAQSWTAGNWVVYVVCPPPPPPQIVVSVFCWKRSLIIFLCRVAKEELLWQQVYVSKQEWLTSSQGVLLYGRYT